MVWQATLVAPRLEPEIMEISLDALVRANRYMLTRYRVPPLYRSGVRYQTEEPPAERWLTAPVALQEGVADCEDLACWRAAELQMQGERARPVYKQEQVSGLPGFRLWHILVERPGGKFEDPSRILGMR